MSFSPSLYQINTRVWLTELSRTLGRPATLDDVPDVELDRFAAMGFDWIWLLSVWQTGAAGLQRSRANAGWRQEFEMTLSDLQEEDIGGSGFAITAYAVAASLGGDAALARLRTRLQERGLRLMLDFVPNHTALDHPWVETHPQHYVTGTDVDLTRSPDDYVWSRSAAGERLLAHGRDPFFPGWPDTLQLDYAEAAAQEAMIAELRAISERCDGVRCDMAMLVLPDVFERTWGRRPADFWATAIGRVREQSPGFTFLAEVYWDLEWTVIGQGFDLAYDKRLYDRLRIGRARPVRDHLGAPAEYQDHLARFLENHDEPRAAAAFGPGIHQAAAMVTYLTPGLRFFHQGQLEGRRVRISPHLVRAPYEPVDEVIRAFYDGLLAVLRRSVVRDGSFGLLDIEPAWEGNGSWDGFIAGSWRGQDGERLVIAVSLAPDQGQCFVRLPFEGLSGATVRFDDLMGEASYQRDGDDLQARGLFLDLAPWGYHVFEVTTA